MGERADISQCCLELIKMTDWVTRSNGHRCRQRATHLEPVHQEATSSGFPTAKLPEGVFAVFLVQSEMHTSN